jgi:hypothetical protein
MHTRATSSVLVATFLAFCALGTPAAAQEDAPPIHVRFETDPGGSLQLWHDDAWEVKCVSSCAFELPAAFTGEIYVLAGRDREAVRLPAPGGTVHVHYVDRSRTKQGLAVAAFAGIVLGLGLIAQGLATVLAKGDGIDPQPVQDRGPSYAAQHDTSAGDAVAGLGVLSLMLGVTAGVAAAVTPKNDFASERTSPPTSRRPTWRDTQTPGVPKPMATNVFTLRF